MDGNPLKWRIYYRDGSTFASDGTWEAAPDRHIIAVVWRYGDGPVQVELGTPYYLNCGDWICRVWDPSLYLRKFGVKFGRWTTNAQFQEAWSICIERVIGRRPQDIGELSKGGAVCATREAQRTDKPFEWVIYYDSGQAADGDSLIGWNEAPTDGVLAVYFHKVISGALIAFGRRRLTHYYWKENGDLENLDFVDEVLPDFPQFKHGEPSFTAKSYLEQGKAIAAALQDKLDDL